MLQVSLVNMEAGLTVKYHSRTTSLLYILRVQTLKNPPPSFNIAALEFSLVIDMYTVWRSEASSSQPC